MAAPVFQAFVPPGGGRAEFRCVQPCSDLSLSSQEFSSHHKTHFSLLAVPPTSTELDLVQKLSEHVILKKCISVGDFYREIIKPDLKFRTVVNTTFGADSARFARCHPDVCTVLANRFIVEPMPPTNYAPKYSLDQDRLWIAPFLNAVRAFMKSQRHSIPVSCISQAFAPWKGPVQLLWGSWKAMLDSNPHLFYISAAGSITGRADLYAIVDTEIQLDKTAVNTFMIQDRRHPTAVIAWSRGRGRPIPFRGVTRHVPVVARPPKPTTRAEKADHWRSGSRSSSSSESSPEGPAPRPRRTSGPSSPYGSDTSDSPTKLAVSADDSPFYVNTNIISTIREGISAISGLQHMNTVAIKAINVKQTASGAQISAIVMTSRSRELPKLPVFVFDLNHLPSLMDHLISIFQDEKIMKVVHSGSSDIAAISSNLGVAVSPFTDTAVMQRMLPGYNTGSVVDVPLKYLLAKYKLPQIPPEVVDGSSEALHLAARDVAHLIDVYDLMLKDMGHAARLESASMSSASFLKRLSDDGALVDAATLTSAARTGKSVQYELMFLRYQAVRAIAKETTGPMPNQFLDLQPIWNLIPEKLAASIAVISKQSKHSIREIIIENKAPHLTFADGSTVEMVEYGEFDSFSSLLQNLKMVPQDQDGALVGLPRTLHRFKVSASPTPRVSFHLGSHFQGYGHLVEDVVSQSSNKPKGTESSILVIGSHELEEHRSSLLRDLANMMSMPDKQIGVAVLDPRGNITGYAKAAYEGIGMAVKREVSAATTPNDSTRRAPIGVILMRNQPEIAVADIEADDVFGVIGATDYGVAIIAGIATTSMVSAMKSCEHRPLFGKFSVSDKHSQQRLHYKHSHASFGTIIEIAQPGKLVVYRNVDQTLESLMNGQPALAEERWLGEAGSMYGRFVQIAPWDETTVRDIADVRK
jgi:hypothetical protein